MSTAHQLRDIWEMERLGGTKFSAGAPHEDRDGDGSSDREEYMAGTDPADPDSMVAYRGAGA